MSINALKAQGTTLHIGSGTSGAKTVTAITKAFKAEVSSTAHGLVKGDRVTFASVGGMTEINTLTATVMDAGTNTFVVDIDSRLFTTYTSGGTATPVTWAKVGECKDVSAGGASVNEIDVTDLDSTGKEFFPGLQDSGDVTVEINYLPTDAGQGAARTAFEGSQIKSYKITTPQGTTYTFNALVKNFPTIPKASVDGVQSGSITLKISGSVTKA
jgi:hypothetical protein